MKTKLTKYLLMGALAIGMSSNVMAVKLVVAPSPTNHEHDVQHKSNPIAFEVTEGEKTATALLLRGKKGDIHGTICYTSVAQTNIAADCYRVTGKISQYGGGNQIELLGNEIKDTKIIQTNTLITYEHTQVMPQINMSTSTKNVAQYVQSDMALGGEATRLVAQYKDSKFITPAGEVPYQKTNVYKQCCL